jgi:hypothetical protein
MNKLISAFCALLLGAYPTLFAERDWAEQSASNLQSDSAQPPVKQLVLEDGTPVRLRISQTVSSEDAHVGDRVEFEVLEEVKVGQTVIIPKGGLAWGTVTEAKPKRRMARGGHLEIVMDSARLADGEKAALRATKESKGGGHTGGMVAGIVITGLLIWPAAPFFLFMHGKEITIPKGTEVPTFVNGDFPLQLAKFSPPAPTVAQPQQTASASAGTLAQTVSDAELKVTSSPAGAEIELDGNFIGSTPSTVGASPGDHLILIRKTGFRLWERKLKVSTGKVDITADLEAEPAQSSAVAAAESKKAPDLAKQGSEAAAPVGTVPAPAVGTGPIPRGSGENTSIIIVASEPAGAEIYVDDLPAGIAPVTLKLKPGKHSIRAFKKGYQNWLQAVTAEGGQNLPLTVAMQKSK